MPATTELLPLAELTALRHALHQHPETAHTEQLTAKRVLDFLRAYPPDTVVTELGGTGIVALYDAPEAGPTVLFRADMDALPITDARTDLPYRSIHPGKAHLCGHDGHTTMVAGLAPALHAQRPKTGRVALLFQPAEEVGEGAAAMLADPRFAALRPDYTFALHNIPGRPLGEVRCREGAFAAASVGVSVQLTGTPAHAAAPETGNTPAPALAKLLAELPGLAQHPKLKGAFAVSTAVGAVLGLPEPRFGTTPGEAQFHATLRTFSDAGLETLQAAFEELLASATEGTELSAHKQWIEPFPATINHPEGVAAIQQAALALGQPYTVMDEPERWSEDFGYFLRSAKGAMFGLGSGEGQPPLHNPRFDFPDALIPIGTGLYLQLVDQLLGWEG